MRFILPLAEAYLNCYSTGSVSGNDCGGICGYSTSSIS